MTGFALVLLLLSAPALLSAEPVDLYRFEVPATIPSPRPSCLEVGPSCPDGPIWGCSDRYLVKDGKPFMPVMAEFHFSRYPAEEWEEGLEKMKAGGVDVVSTYVFWIHHEEVEGVFDFSGQRDLRRFVELCGKHGLYVWLRIGPWCHGEVRNGGFPDWLRKPFGLEENSHLGWRGGEGLRSNDPAYLKLVDRLYAAYGEQCRGLMAKDGGPIIGVQMENEYSKTGQGKGEVHIAALIRLAKEHGFNVPFFNVTGWHNAPFPATECLPMFNGYPAAPWAIGTRKLTPRRVYRFDLQRRTGGSYYPETDTRRDLSPYPLLFCEIAVGNETTDHRRPQVGTLDGAAVAYTRLGVGAAGLGYYMYHGGTNPDGKFAALQESRATGYPNDCPVKSYDFQAPIRESGRIDAKYRYLRELHLFMHDFAHILAPTIALPPDRAPRSDEDFGPVRMALRTDGKSGFLFVNNHVRGYPQPDRKNVQVAVALGGREIHVPVEPVTVPSDSFFIWPVELPLVSSLLLYSTAQPLCVLENGEDRTYVFAQTITDRPEYVFDPGTVEGKAVRFTVEPGVDSMVEVSARNGKNVHILTLTREQALHAFKYKHHGQEHLLVCEADPVAEGNRIDLFTTSSTPVRLAVYPALELIGAGLESKDVDGEFTIYSITPPAVKIDSSVVDQIGKNRWSIKTGILPERARLRINYAGDTARLFLGDRLVYDNFYNGDVFEVGLDRLSGSLRESGLTLEIIPLEESKEVYLDVSRPEGDPILESIEIVAEHRISMTVE